MAKKKASSKRGITRRDFVKIAGMAGASVVGAGVLGKAPAFAQERSLHFLLWKNFSPPADVEILRQGEEWSKQSKVKVKIEQINANDIPARAAAAIESKQGPDIIQFFHNWQNQYGDSLVDVTDICTALESKYGGYIPYAKADAMLNGKFNAVPHTIVPNIFVVRSIVHESRGDGAVAQDLGGVAARRQKVEGGWAPDRADGRTHLRRCRRLYLSVSLELRRSGTGREGPHYDQQQTDAGGPEAVQGVVGRCHGSGGRGVGRFGQQSRVSGGIGHRDQQCAQHLPDGVQPGDPG